MALIFDYVSEDTGLISKKVNGYLPQTAFIPLKKNNQESVQILIKEGESVKEGQVIARDDHLAIHSSIPGKVEEIVHTQFVDGSEGFAAKIRLQGSFSFTGKQTADIDYGTFERNTIHFSLNEKGVLNTFDSVQPLALQIESLDKTRPLILTLRLFSDDPSRISDSFIADNYLEEAVTGACIVAKAMDAAGVVIARDSNKEDYDFDSIVAWKNLKCQKTVVSLDARTYPCGFMHEITQAVKNAARNQPFKNIGNKDLYIDVQTAVNVYNAIVKNMPVTTCSVHLTGDCINTASVMKVKIGTLISDLAKQSGGFKRVPSKVIINGKITGNALSAMNIPISQEVKSVCFIPENQVPYQVEENCIRCGKCSRICPVGLQPESLLRCYNNINPDDAEISLIKKTSVLCTGCSLCNAVCPSRISLSHKIAELKKGFINEK